MAASIKPIDKTSIHRIHSGQVVLDLQSCLKELVENALDASATSIEVRIKDSGTTSIEVVDNGSGIAQADWGMIGLKHHTSKLPDLALLPSVTTFGFRGEALSALCALCESVTVVTSTQETQPMGAVLQLGRDGRVLDNTGRVAKQRGTTITLTNLFAPLPVRRKEFERNAKKELTKALVLLTAYALVPASSSDGVPGIRLRVDSLVSGGKNSKRNSMLSNDGRGDLRANVMAIWGSKALEGVTDVDLDLEVMVDKMARREGVEEGNQIVKVKGLLSSASWGQGRSSADRQYFYVNGRPADLKVVQKVVNEVYKSFNTNQVPLAILDIIIPRESVDINVSPDKRTIMLHSESNLLSALRIGLEQFFAPTRSTFAVEGATQSGRVTKSTQSKLTLGSSSTPGPSAEAPATVESDNEEEAEDDPELATPVETPPSTKPPPTRHPQRVISANAEAGPSRQTRAHQEVITLLDEDEPDSTPQSSLSQSQTRAPRTHPTPIVATPAISPASPARKRTQGIIDTTQASWSPDRKAASTKGKSTKAGSGIEARKSLRERLKVYSQAEAIEVENDEDVTAAEIEEEMGHPIEDDDEGFSELVPEEEAEKVEGSEVTEDDENGEIEPDWPGDTPEDKENGDEEEQGGDEGEEEGGKEMEVDDDGEEVEPNVPIDVQDDSEEDDEVIHTSSPVHAKPGRNGAATDVRRIASSSLPVTQAIAEDAPTTTSKRIRAPVPSPAPSAATPDATQSERDVQAYRSEIPSSTTSGEITLSFSLPRLKARYAAKSRQRISETQSPMEAYPKLQRSGMTAEAGIANRDSHSAEEALARVISKNDFASMEVIGQFNKGFIIARLRKDGDGGTDDLFVVDQHASDEKFNFETLQLTTRIKGQALIKPRPLELTAADELTAIENLPILKANGFEVDVDEGKPPGRGERVKLVAMPVSKETVFDFKDLEQLLHMLSDSAHATGQMVRCTKARSMFAMRACRKSVMIGKSLTKGQMSQLLRNMGTLDQPWSCPHGRPTLRHLAKIESKKAHFAVERIDWGSWRTYI